MAKKGKINNSIKQGNKSMNRKNAKYKMYWIFRKIKVNLIKWILNNLLFEDVKFIIGLWIQDVINRNEDSTNIQVFGIGQNDKMYQVDMEIWLIETFEYCKF